MALRAEEILRIKWELGVNVTNLGAEPYITYLAIFEQAIQPFIVDPTTTSATIVQQYSGGQQVQITVAAIPTLPAPSTTVPAFTVGTRLVIDVGPNQEESDILVLTGTTLWLTLANAHGQNGAYPVTMTGGEHIIREILRRLEVIGHQLTSVAPMTAGISQADEVKFYASTGHGGRGQHTIDKGDALVKQREQARDDLGEAVGFPNLRRAQRGGSRRLSAY